MEPIDSVPLDELLDETRGLGIPKFLFNAKKKRSSRYGFSSGYKTPFSSVFGKQTQEIEITEENFKKWSVSTDLKKSATIHGCVF